MLVLLFVICALVCVFVCLTCVVGLWCYLFSVFAFGCILSGLYLTTVGCVLSDVCIFDWMWVCVLMGPCRYLFLGVCFYYDCFWVVCVCLCYL